MPPQVWDEPPKGRDRQANYPSEQTPLVLMPSGHSTDRSSSENLAFLEAAAGNPNNGEDAELGQKKSSRRADDKTHLQFWPGQQALAHQRNGFDASAGKFQKKRSDINKALFVSFLTISLTTLYFLWKEGIFMQQEVKAGDADYFACREPFSRLDPVHDLGLANFDRPQGSRPSSVVQHSNKKMTRPIPTNAWYQNLLMLGDDTEPTEFHRAYAIPYVLDAAGPIPGLRMHTNHISSSSNVIQLTVNNLHGVTMGAIHRTSGPASKNVKKAFSVQEMTQLAVTLRWEDFGMSTPIVKGMPYATMSYDSLEIVTPHGILAPAIATEVPVAEEVIIDGHKKMSCSSEKRSFAWVEKEIQFFSPESDFTWLVFVSEKVQISCQTFGSNTIISAESSTDRLNEEVKPFHFRTALFKPCTNGRNPVYCHQEQLHPTALLTGQGEYGKLLRSHAHLYPGPKASVSYEINSNETAAALHFDWDVQAISAPLYPTLKNETVKELITYALPHHVDMMKTVRSPSDDLYCSASLVGPSCLVEGSSWHLLEELPPISFRAERSPPTWSLASIAKSLETDIKFRLPDYFQRGAGDTYFSGKMIARLGRVLVISEEIEELCKTKKGSSGCQNATLPSKRQMTNAIDALRASVEVWLNGTAEAPFVFDSAWGGVANCGCDWDDGTCANKFPDCPAFGNPGLNFGNAFYNDMHFHYGYHIFGAAVVSHFDPEWGRDFFERVLLLVRNIANPSEDDEYFPVMRHKDVFQGHSWASGIATWVLNGRNQESSSESVAAYESVALYGKVMASVFEEIGSREEYNRAVEVRRVGKLLTASELRSARKYYHVKQEEEIKIYPGAYTPHVIGIMWQTMAQFQTWFGAAPYLATGIQLLPLTPIAGRRDEIDWAKEMYPSLEESCNADEICEEQGWSVLQLGALSTVGHAKLALQRAKLLPTDVFETAGGNGHSMTNTLWYIATREPVEEPLPLKDDSTIPDNVFPAKKFPNDKALFDCYRPETCTEYVLDTIVDLYSCRQRINFLIKNMFMSQKEACVQVAAMEYPDECGKCNPLANYEETIKAAKEAAARQCPPCTEQQCHGDLNRCPSYENTFVCTAGRNEGGCAGNPWEIVPWSCAECCELTNCPKISPLELTTLESIEAENELIEAEKNCPVCTKEQCKSNLCPVHVAPYLCIEGSSTGGCSMRPWGLEDGQCQECCKVPADCSS